MIRIFLSSLKLGLGAPKRIIMLNDEYTSCHSYHKKNMY